MFKVSILCVQAGTNWAQIEGVDLWDLERDAWKFDQANPVITHAPCAQWSRMRNFSRPDRSQKNLAFWCFELVNYYGGIFEHPHASSFYKEVGVKPTLCIDQHQFGFPARKRTWLYHTGFDWLPQPLNFGAITHSVGVARVSRGKLIDLPKSERSLCPVSLCQWLVDNVRQIK